MDSHFLLSRNLTSSTVDSSNPHISILQWNTLNSMLADAKGFPNVAPHILDFDNRKKLLEKEMEAFIADGVDFACFQEINRNDLDFFTQAMKGYDYQFKHKIKGFDGVLVFYKRDRFYLLETQQGIFVDPKEKSMYGQVYQINLFNIPKTDYYVMLVTTHLKAKAEFSAIRVDEMNQLFDRIRETKNNFRDRFGDKAKLATVFCGDLNDEPQSDCVKLILEHKMKSVYEDADFTTFKLREKLYKRVIDYIFYDGDVKYTGARLELPKDSAIGEIGLPAEDYPSDHISLYAKFAFEK